MSSKALRTVLFPEPERPVRMTSCRCWRVECCFTGGAGSALYPALVGAGDAHIFAVDARTGKACSSFGDNGVVDLLTGMGTVGLTLDFCLHLGRQKGIRPLLGSPPPDPERAPPLAPPLRPGGALDMIARRFGV